jgi:hypothetical protein
MLNLVGYTWKYICDAGTHERQIHYKQVLATDGQAAVD